MTHDYPQTSPTTPNKDGAASSIFPLIVLVCFFSEVVLDVWLAFNGGCFFFPFGVFLCFLTASAAHPLGSSSSSHDDVRRQPHPSFDQVHTPRIVAFFAAFV